MSEIRTSYNLTTSSDFAISCVKFLYGCQSAYSTQNYGVKTLVTNELAEIEILAISK